MSLCAAMVLLGTPRGQNFVAEAAEGSLLSLVGSGDHPVAFGPATITATFVAFDLSAFPTIASYTPATSESFYGAWCRFGNPSSGGDCALAASLGSLAVCTHVGSPPCVGCWSGAGRPVVHVGGLQMGADLSPLPAALLPSWSVPVAFGASVAWSPGVEVAHCAKCAVTLVAGADAPVTVAGDEATGWTLTRTGAGTTVLDLTVGDFTVGEVTVTEAAGNPDTTPDTTPNPPVETTTPGYLEATVDVNGRTQRLRVYNPNNVDLTCATLTAEAVTAHEYLDDTHPIEHLLSYNISLLDANDNPLDMPLSDTVELCFEVLDGLDRDELEVVLAQQFSDGEFEEELVEIDGASWVKVTTDHFSPYALIDKLTDAEKGVQVQDDPAPKNNVKTGDQAVQVAVAGLGMTLVLALGIMLRLLTSKRKFEE